MINSSFTFANRHVSGGTFDLVSARDLARAGAIGWSINAAQGATFFVIDIVEYATRPGDLREEFHLVLGFLLGAVLAIAIGSQARSGWRRGLTITAAMPEPAQVRRGRKAIPGIWIMLWIGFAFCFVLRVSEDIPSLGMRHWVAYMYVAGWGGVMISACSWCSFSWGVLCWRAYRSIVRTEIQEGTQLIGKFDPLGGFGIDLPNRQFYLWRHPAPAARPA